MAISNEAKLGATRCENWREHGTASDVLQLEEPLSRHGRAALGATGRASR